ncbi:extensin family protein [Sinorhizobium sp. 8-89]|uniref:extensin-like domain-containing protein n=1 Tax=Sinorhizobium sp. 7-81 TaxID=3049087 RepID=UPI0024C2A769|nr:extensin family protein [Sinorhizobium sp. 7-81]MDK1387234.1 extensin family protein [Sinorhizobium sp. 7-81]
MRHSAGIILLSVLILSGVSLPKKGPIPAEKPGVAGEQATPEPKPAPPPRDDEGDADERGETSAEPDQEEKDGVSQDGAPAGEDAEEPIIPVQDENPEAHASCLAALKALGGTFVDAKRIDDGKGCGIDKPLRVSAVLPGVALKPEGTMRCAAALALARWTKESAIPAAATAFGPDTRITALNQASAYVCRRRNNATTGKISEHAHGNAVDIASFTLDDGRTIAIQPRDEDGTLTGAFQRAVTATACLYFTTVLDPGSDPAHETHLHLDVIERKNGYRYCR